MNRRTRWGRLGDVCGRALAQLLLVTARAEAQQDDARARTAARCGRATQMPRASFATARRVLH